MAGGEEVSRIRLIVGLGNPGRQYVNTRHNVGFLILDRLVDALGESWASEKRWEAKVARADGITYLKPQTFMNLSGRAVAKVAKFYKITPEEILVVHDDVALPLGRLRFRARGSAGGHNGIKSIVADLGSQDFPRLKVGIGADEIRADMKGFVLGKFRDDEAEIVEKSLQDSMEALRCALDSGLEVAMNQFNRSPEPRKPKPAPPPREEESTAPRPGEPPKQEDE